MSEIFPFSEPPVRTEFMLCMKNNGEEVEILSVHSDGDIFLEGELIVNYKEIIKRRQALKEKDSESNV